MQKPEASIGTWYAGLDGVRAVAVLLVFSVHYLGRQTLYAGWTGVLVFFVLSGFLITGILFDNQNESHRFRNFYVRRTLRIFPLFYFVWLLIFVSAIFIHLYLKPIQLLWFIYLGNYVRFLAGTPIVDHIFTSRPSMPLEIGHFWSLAVEEQFYLIWPLVVFFVRDRRKLINICMSTIVLTLALRVVLYLLVPQKVLAMEFLYRMTFTQCDAFLLGGLLALWMRGPEKAKLFLHAHKFFYGSLALLAAAYLLNNGLHPVALSSTSSWMSTYGFTLVDMCAAGLILCALQPRSPVFRFLTLKPLRVLGRYSYGFYVYHVLLAPFLVMLLPSLSLSLPKPIFYGGLILLWVVDFLIVLAVSACSYHLIELPFLGLKDRFTVRHENPSVPAVMA